MFLNWWDCEDDLFKLWTNSHVNQVNYLAINYLHKKSDNLHYYLYFIRQCNLELISIAYMYYY